MPRGRLPGVAIAALLLVPGAGAAASQVHLSQLPEGVVVQWALPGDTRALPPGSVEFGPTPWYGQRARAEMVGYVDASPYVGYSTTNIARDLAEAAATLYRAQLPPMPAGTSFHYRIVDGAGGVSAPYAARSLPGPSSSVRFVAYGDQGTLEDGAVGPPVYRPMEVVNVSLAQDPDLVLIAGDLSYAKEGALRFWNQWFDLLEPLASGRPAFAAVGNHDRDFVTGYEQWSKRFSFPREEQNYGFDAGPVHFLVVNSQEACLEGETTESVQRVNPNCSATSASGAPLENKAITDFMRQDLAAARARGVPWIVAVFHHPPYAHGGYNESNSGSAYMWWMREHWLPILEEHGVDLVITGHDHSYARSFPMLDDRPTVTSGSKSSERDGIVYVVTGGGGRQLYYLSPDPPSWLAHQAAKHHVVVVDATSQKMKVVVRDHEGVAFDAFEIRKGPAASQAAMPPWLALAAIAGIAAGALRRRA